MSAPCVYCGEVPADPHYDRCRDCRTWRDEEWCELAGHPVGVPTCRVPCTCMDPELAGGNRADGSHWIPCPAHDERV